MGLLSGLFSDSERGTRKSTLARRRAARDAGRLSLARKIAIGLGVLCLLLWGGVWFFLSNADQHITRMVKRNTVKATADMGFKVENILVEGRIHSDAGKLLGLVGVEKGDPMFSFDPVAAKALIEEISWVKSAHVERRLPDTIYIKLEERKPFALWKEKDKLVLIDRDGAVLTDEDLKRFSDLVMILGDHAPEHAQELVDMLEAEPVIKKRVDSAKWVESRRWNLNMKDGKLIKLPEEDIGLALRRLALKHEEEGILDKPIASIDVRDPARFIVQTEPGKVQDFKNQDTESPKQEKPEGTNL